MMKFLTAAALAALVASPALAQPYSHYSVGRARAHAYYLPVPPNAYAYDFNDMGGNYGAALRGAGGLPLANGTAQGTGGVIGGGPGAWQ